MLTTQYIVGALQQLVAADRHQCINVGDFLGATIAWYC